MVDRMADDDPVVHCELADSVNLRAGLEAAYIEHLEVDAERTRIVHTAHFYPVEEAFEEPLAVDGEQYDL